MIGHTSLRPRKLVFPFFFLPNVKKGTGGKFIFVLVYQVSEKVRMDILLLFFTLAGVQKGTGRQLEKQNIQLVWLYCCNIVI